MENIGLLILGGFILAVMFICALLSKFVSEAAHRRENRQHLKTPAITEDLKDRFNK